MSIRCSDEEILFLRSWNIIPCDRTGLLSHCLQFQTPNLSVPDKGSPVSLQECIASRCSELSRLKNPVLMWSGGIDSTLVFYALKESGIRFECTISEDAKTEYPRLYEEIRNNEHEGVTPVSTKVILEENRSNKTFITGEIGDQIIGTDKFLTKYTDFNSRSRPAEEEFTSAEYKEYYTAIRKVLGKNDLTVAEFAWALNFLFKFSHVAHRTRNYFNFKKNEVVHFFLTDMFQRWALHNYESNVNFDSITDYKMAYKDYIYSINGDAEYRTNKVKIPSLNGQIGRVA